MTTKNNIVKSKISATLDALDYPYRIKGRTMTLLEPDSLQITLEGKYIDHWRRWSTDDKGFGVESLISYLIKEGFIDSEKGKAIVKEIPEIKAKEIVLPKPKKIEFDKMVKDPVDYPIRKYLIKERKLHPSIVNLLTTKGKIIQDGRGSLRFLWMDKDSNVSGGDVQIIKEVSVEQKKKMILEGSKGFFYLLTKDCQEKIQLAERIIFFEAPIDLISYIELTSYPESAKNKSAFEFPESEPKTLFISMSGALTKVKHTIDVLSQEFNINLRTKELIVATDNDEIGDAANNKFNELGFKTKRIKPNKGLPHKGLPIKDWNDLLKLIKGGK